MKGIRGTAIAGLIGAAALAVSPAAFSQDVAEKGFYIGATVGQSKVKDFCEGLVASCEDTDTSLRILGGYQFSKHFALEVGYHQLGEVGVTNGALFAKVESTALEFVAVGMLPVTDQFSVFGKLGVYRGETDFSTNIVAPGIPSTFSESNTDLTFGFGLQFDVTKNLGLRAEWQRYQDLGGPQIGESDVDVMSIGVVYRFR